MNSDEINNEIEDMKRINTNSDNFGVTSAENTSQSELNSDADDLSEIPRK